MTEVQVLPQPDPSGFDWLSPVVSLDVAKKRFNDFREFVKALLEEGVDYGQVGPSSKKTLLKPGAEKLSMIYGLEPSLELMDKIEDWGDGDREPLFFYRYRATLKRNGRLVGTGEGACTSREKKYRYRKGSIECPECGEAALIKSKQQANSYHCWAGKGGCGANFDMNDPAITDQDIDTNLNPDIADQVNTFIKIAVKRAFIAAMLMAVAASGLFTQDLEDFDHNRRPQRQQQGNGSYPQQQSNGQQGNGQQQQANSGPRRISEAQEKRFFAKCTSSGWTRDQVDAYLRSMGWERGSDITVAAYEDACRWADSRPGDQQQQQDRQPDPQPRGTGPQRRSGY